MESATNQRTISGRFLTLDPCGGMAGDMFLAGLLDLGESAFTIEHLHALAEDLLPGEARLEGREVLRQGLRAMHLQVHTPESHHAPHRGWKDLRERIEACTLLEPKAARRAQRVIEAIARAEGAVHGKDPEEIHFHEVGAVDTLIDVCGAAYAWQLLGYPEVYARPALLGEGTVRCAHGVLPVPAPATAQLLEGLPVKHGGGQGERVTPTGAALLATFAIFEEPRGTARCAAWGFGAGTRDPQRAEGPANFLRLGIWNTEPNAGQASEVWQLEVNLDDITGQDLGAAVESVWKAGALDVWTSSIQMKKQRPGTLLAALVPHAERDAVADAVLKATPTFGLRWIATQRVECERRFETVTCAGHEIRIKLRRMPSAQDWQAFPEFEDLQALAAAQGIPLWEARERVLAAYRASPGI